MEENNFDIENETPLQRKRRVWREWYLRNREEVLQQRKFKRTTDWYAKNRLESQSYYMRNREKVLEKQRVYRETHRAEISLAHKKHYLKKKEQELKEYSKPVPKPKEKKKPVKPDHRKKYAKKIREKICKQGFYELPKSENPFLVTWD